MTPIHIWLTTLWSKNRFYSYISRFILSSHRAQREQNAHIARVDRDIPLPHLGHMQAFLLAARRHAHERALDQDLHQAQVRREQQRRGESRVVAFVSPLSHVHVREQSRSGRHMRPRPFRLSRPRRLLCTARAADRRALQLFPLAARVPAHVLRPSDRHCAPRQRMPVRQATHGNARHCRAKRAQRSPEPSSQTHEPRHWVVSAVPSRNHRTARFDYRAEALFSTHLCLFETTS